jgi:hypothetical protein
MGTVMVFIWGIVFTVLTMNYVNVPITDFEKTGILLLFYVVIIDVIFGKKDKEKEDES